MNNTNIATASAQELSNQEIDAVSGGILFLAAFALGTMTGGGLTAAGIWLWNEYH